MRILIAIIIAALATAITAAIAQDGITVTAPMTFKTDWIEPSPATYDPATSNWTVAATIRVPRGQTWTNAALPFVVERMTVKTEQVVISDTAMQSALGEAYPALRAAAELGTLIPGETLKDALIDTLAAQLEVPE